jgi:hypothetical protein
VEYELALKTRARKLVVSGAELVQRMLNCFPRANGSTEGEDFFYEDRV